MFKDFKRKLDAVFDVESYGYKVNKWILRSAFILMILLLLVVVKFDGVDAVRGSWWFTCPDDAVMPCLNPFYDQISCSEFYCMDEFIPIGVTLGDKPSWLARSFSWICIFLFVLGLLLNHLIYNKNFRVKKNVEME